MQTIAIVVSDLTHKAKYLHCPRTGKHDIVGQLLFSLGYYVPPKSRLVTDLGKHIPPFTTYVRDTVVNSPLSIELLQASSILPPRELVAACNAILAKHKAPYKLVKA